jgi:hypothetical protein
MERNETDGRCTMVDRWTYGLRAERLRQSREVEGLAVGCAAVPVVVLVRVPDVAAQRHARPKKEGSFTWWWWV